VAYTTLDFDLRDGIARITLNRPEAANALNLEMGHELVQALTTCAAERGLRVVVLTGAGKAFCAGGDLRSFGAQADGLPAHLREVTTWLHVAVSYMVRMDAPVIAAVNGVAAGAGMSLACAGDIAIATESARFTMAYTRAGLSPDGSSTFFLPRLIGLRRALDLTLTNRMLSAREALDWGLVSQVVPDGEFVARVDALAQELSQGPTRALGAAKRLLWTGWNESLETQMAHESETISQVAKTSDAHEGIAAFTGKRAPQFRGE
jgi:2-(1,2-epoxy-1,2-dihydrophenyl)acetyl-CoA isomerase